MRLLLIVLMRPLHLKDLHLAIQLSFARVNNIEWYVVSACAFLPPAKMEDHMRRFTTR